MQRTRVAGGLLDVVVLCGDVGWRKPARRVFDYACGNSGVSSDECAFVGDDLERDIAGSAAAGMHPILIDRDDRYPGVEGARMKLGTAQEQNCREQET
jgi:FMN phosphatase YigB (HAD superfamily)